MRMDQSSASTEIPISPLPENAASAAKAPTAAELEEFFTEAEEYIRKRFAEKYNYDIVKDAPMVEGRYQWVRTHTSV